VGVPLGMIAALRHNTSVDYSAMFVSNVFHALPNFLVATLMIYYVALKWGGIFHLPTSGWSGWKYKILPSIALGFGPMALFARLVRGTMLETLQQDYVRTARAKGLAEQAVIVRHALRNALIPVVTLLGLQLGILLGGAVITETVFAWPGMGMATVTAIHQRDYPVVQCAVFVSAVLVVSINWAVDTLYNFLDPRIRVAE
jgi:ABC-type dipeptide/oligopeptide/nickel transport system permease component